MSFIKKPKQFVAGLVITGIGIWRMDPNLILLGGSMIAGSFFLAQTNRTVQVNDADTTAQVPIVYGRAFTFESWRGDPE